MVDLEQALGADLMDPARRREVIERLRTLPFPAQDRGWLLRRWAALVGYRYTSEELERVMGDGD
jgi:hypothetical protein